MQKAFKGLGSFLLFLLFPLYAAAFVPEPSLIVELMLESMGGRDSMEMGVQRVLFPADGKPVTIEERFFFKIPEAFRSETGDGSSFWLATAEDDFLLVHEGKRFSDSKPRLEDYFYAPLLLREKECFARFLQRRGVDLTRSSLERYGGKICYCLGNTGQSHLLVDKDSFLPLFLILEDRESGITRRAEFRYSNWHREEEAAFPAQIDILDRDGVLLQEIRIMQPISASLEDRLMEPDVLRKGYPLLEEEPRPSIVEPDLPDPVKEADKIVDRFRRRFE